MEMNMYTLTKEQRQHIVDALDYMTRGTVSGGNDMVKAALNILRNLPEQSGEPEIVAYEGMPQGMGNEPDMEEPVAWIEVFKHGGGEKNWERRLVWDRPNVRFPEIHDAEPLYAAPQPAAVQEPVSEDKVKQLVHQCTHRDIDGNWYVDGVALVHATCFALDSIRKKAPQPAADVVKDAARYREVRKGQRWSVINGIGDALRAESLDYSIDAAMSAAQGEAE
jgi:hypothetical protein